MRSRWLLVLALLAVAAPIAWNGSEAIRQGWTPEGDAAIITIRTHDVFTAHTPLLGMPTTAGKSDPGDVFHPGPLEFQLLAVPLRAFGVTGMVAGTVLLNIAAVAGVLWFARRRGGDGLLLWGAVLCTVLVWALGDEIPHDPYNPHVVLLPMTFLLVLVWSLACGDLLALPLAVGTVR